MPSPRDFFYITILPENMNNPAVEDNASITIKFDTMPATITDSKQAVFQDTAIIGRSSPLKTFQFSGARTINFALDFFVSIEQDPNQLESDDEAALNVLKTKLNTLRGIVHPSNKTTMRRPRKCIIRMGEAFGMLAFCKSISIVYKGDSPWQVNPVLAHHATVNFVLEETGETIYSFNDIRADAELKNISSVNSQIKIA
jgi:hypothetical protein